MSDLETAHPLEVEEFLRLIRGDPGRWSEKRGKTIGIKPPTGEVTAAIAVGWTPRKLRLLKRDPEFVLLMKEARDRLFESIEAVVYRQAFRGTRWATEMILYSQASDRGWHPPTQKHEIHSIGRVDVAIVASVKEAVKAQLSQGDVLELQQAEIVDAEIVDEND